MKLFKTLLLIAGAAAIVVTPRIISGLHERFGRLDFDSYAPVPAFRQLAGGKSSGRAFDPLVGLGGEQGGAHSAAATDPVSLCDALFFDRPSAGEAVPVAYFSDYNCPYCRVLSDRLADLAETGEIAISLHELPLLGQSSRIAARAALSARAQGAHMAMHEALMSTRFAPTPAYLGTVAARIGLAKAAVIDGMHASDVDAALGRSAALAERFGFIGTPDLVVGSTVVVGEIGADRLRRLVDRERRDGPLAACSSRSGTSLQQKRGPTSTQLWNLQTWLRS